MITTTRRSFTDEFKREAVSLLASSGRPLTQVATELGIQPSMLRTWRDALNGAATPALGRGAPAAVSAASAEQAEIRRLRRELDLFGETYNEAWKDNWGFVPYSKRDLDHYAQELQLVFDRNWFMIAEKVDTGESVGVAITVPDINQVLRKMNGRFLPFGWWHFLFGRRRITKVRVGFLGVKPEYQHTGVAAGLYIEHFDTAARTRQKGGEMGWILETNDAMNRAMEGMGGSLAKRYRVYERVLAA